MAVRRNPSRSIAPLTVVAAFFAVAWIPSPALAGLAIRKVLHFDNNAGQLTVPAKTEPNLLTPSKCRTFTYTAGSGEFAIATMAATASPSSVAEGSLRMAVTRSLPFEPFVAMNIAAQVESFADGTAMVSSRARITLAEGSTYQFGAGFAADQETALSTFACQGTVIIYAEEP